MIVITLGAERMIDPREDDLGRDRVGYSPTMSPMALYDASHGAWHLGERANREHFALMTFDGEGVLAIDIDRIEPVSGMAGGREGSRRSVIHGDILAKGHPIYDSYVGKRSPLLPQRNPIGYFDAPEEHAPCLCGCGGPTPAGKDFIPGHDQTALHDRVRQIGTVRDFIDWFDRVRGGYWPDVHQPRLAWDGARAFVAATMSAGYPWLSERVGRQLGGAYQRQLAETRDLLHARPDATHVEAGVWRVRLEDLLRHRPELTGDLAVLVRETTERLRARSWNTPS